MAGSGRLVRRRKCFLHCGLWWFGECQTWLAMERDPAYNPAALFPEPSSKVACRSSLSMNDRQVNLCGKDARKLNSRRLRSRSIWWCARATRGLLSVLCVLLASLSLRAEIQMPVPNWTSSIVIEGQEAVGWKEGAYDVFVFHSPCQLRQGDMLARGNAGVVWVERVAP